MLDVLQLEMYAKNKLDINKELELNLIDNKERFDNIINKIIKSGIDYGIKSLNIKKESEGIVNSIGNITKSKDLKNIVKSAVSVSLSQALENNKGDFIKLKNIDEFKDIALKGGLRYLLSAGVDILFNKNFKLNLFKPVVEKLVKTVKNFIMSNSFIQKLNSEIGKILEKKNQFKELCDKWYKAYDEFNINSINDIAKEIDVKKEILKNDSECLRDNTIIQNMTKLINAKKDKLSQIQLQICGNL